MSTDLDILRARLVERAERDGLLDVAYRTIDSPLGTLLLASTEAGLVRVAFDIENHDTVLATLAERISPRVLRAPSRLDDAARKIDGLLSGAARSADLPLDLRLAGGFRRTVLDHLREIPYGTTRSYAEVAAQTTSPHAVRAVGTACARNPLPLVIPCHRVVRSDGTPGRYAGGDEAKRRLLALEAGR